MSKFKVKVIRIERVERSIVVDVEASSMEEAIEKQSEDNAPHYDAGWVTDKTQIIRKKVVPVTDD